MSATATMTATGRQPQGGRTGRAQLLTQSVYALVSFPISIAAFVVGLVSFVLGASMIILVIGLPLLALAAYLVRGFAHAERAMLNSMMQISAPTPRYLRPRDPGLSGRILTPLRDPQTWLDLAFAIVRLPLGIFSFVVTVVWWSITVFGLTYPLYGWSIPDGPGDENLPELLGIGDGYLITSVVYVAIGIIGAITLPWAIRIASWAHAGPALLMLSGRASMQDEIERVTVGRTAARTAQASELRRLERDIHDGPQQRLVRLSMDLGRLRNQLEQDPELARTTLDGAIGQTRDTLDELRALSRGIAPPILVDRGLEAALEEIATRQQVPVHLELIVPDDLPSHVETTAYFIVAEALTNIAKHSGASVALVEIDGGYANEPLRVRVSDDGDGGASIAKGHGLGGLDDRLRSVDGVLNVTSPIGGPTTLEAHLPCE